MAAQVKRSRSQKSDAEQDLKKRRVGPSELEQLESQSPVGFGTAEIEVAPTNRVVRVDADAGDIWEAGKAQYDQLEQSLLSVTHEDLLRRAVFRETRKGIPEDKVDISKIVVTDTLHAKKNRQDLVQKSRKAGEAAYSRQGRYANDRCTVIQNRDAHPLDRKLNEFEERPVNFQLSNYLELTKLEEDAYFFIPGDGERVGGGFWEAKSYGHASDEVNAIVCPILAVQARQLEDDKVKVRPGNSPISNIEGLEEIQPVLIGGVRPLCAIDRDVSGSRAGIDPSDEKVKKLREQRKQRPLDPNRNVFYTAPEVFAQEPTLVPTEQNPKLNGLYAAAPDVSRMKGKYTKEIVCDLIVTCFKMFALVEPDQDGHKSVHHVIGFGTGVFGHSEAPALTAMFVAALLTNTNLNCHSVGRTAFDAAKELASQIVTQARAHSGAVIEDVVELAFQEIDARASVELPPKPQLSEKPTEDERKLLKEWDNKRAGIEAWRIRGGQKL